MMNLDLTKPCKGTPSCPFRTDCLEGWLGRDRAQEIVDSITTGDLTFQCHKTLDLPKDKAQHCAGATILLEKLDQPNQWMRIAERLGWYDRNALDMGQPVFDTPEEFVNHHGRKPR